MTDLPDYARIRYAKRKVEDETVARAILDQGIVAHVGFVADGRPMVIPMAYAVDGPCIYLHGAVKTRIIRETAGLPMCLTVTHVDGLVVARSGFNSSVNYRSVVVHGTARIVAPGADFDRALDLVVDHLMPGRSAEVRAVGRQERKATGVLALDIQTMTVKIRSGGPVDDEEDRGLDIWSGVLPIGLALSRGVPDGFTPATRPEPASLSAARKKFSA